MAQRRHREEKHVPPGSHRCPALRRHLVPDGEQDPQPGFREQRAAVRALEESVEGGEGASRRDLPLETCKRKIICQVVCLCVCVCFLSFILRTSSLTGPWKGVGAQKKENTAVSLYVQYLWIS